jgi:hypothetical protein
MVTWAERLWRRVDKSDGCWLWTGAVESWGYGYMNNRRSERPPRRVRVHRLSWELANGPIPEGLWVLHTCDTPACVRPDHLFLGTVTDNNRDAARKGRYVRQQSVMACPQGHPLTPDNLRPCTADKKRQCRLCHNERQRAYNARKRVRDLVAAVAIVVG